MLSDNVSTLTRSERDVTYYSRKKTYPDGSWEVLAATRPIFREAGWELSDLSDSYAQRVRSDSEHTKNSAANAARSRRRAAARMRDYALCTDFRFFVTLTFSAESVNRYDIGGIVKRIRAWLDNRVRRKGLSYILVPEHHKDGAVHFHGFFSDCDIGFVDSGTLDADGWRRPRKPRSQQERMRLLSEGARIVYNISDWSYGFTTAIELYGERAAAVGYCTKYLTKQTDKIGGRWYYSGGALKTPVVTFWDWSYYDVLEACPDAYAFEVEGANLGLVITRGVGKILDLGAEGCQNPNLQFSECQIEEKT